MNYEIADPMEKRLIDLLVNIENHDCASSKIEAGRILEENPELNYKWGKVYRF